MQVEQQGSAQVLGIKYGCNVRRYRALMNFLSNVLREDGGFEYKKAIVDSILILIKDIPDAKEPGLGHLCEFIEVRELLLTFCWALRYLLR